jgi:hypothetical protein
LLQGRFDALLHYAFHAALEYLPTHPCVGVRSNAAHPCLSKLKCTSMYISPWQNPLCEATLKGYTELKETAKAKAKNKSWIPVSTGMTMHYSITAFIFALQKHSPDVTT